MWDKIQNLTIEQFENLSEEERKAIEEYKDPVIEEIDNVYSDDDKRKEMEEEVNAVNEFWKEEED